MSKLNVLSGGAAMGLVRTLEPELRSAVGVEVQGSYGAVGAMKEKLESGAPCAVSRPTAGWTGRR
jgi:molybdate transport system substrate-binding protein